MMHNEKDKQSQGHTECYKRSNERSQMITSDFESKVSSMKDVLLDVALKELINCSEQSAGDHKVGNVVFCTDAFDFFRNNELKFMDP